MESLSLRLDLYDSSSTDGTFPQRYTECSCIAAHEEVVLHPGPNQPDQPGLDAAPSFEAGTGKGWCRLTVQLSPSPSPSPAPVSTMEITPT